MIRPLATAILVMSLIVGLFALIFHSIDVHEDQRLQRAQEWVKFSQQHHCQILKRSGPWDANVLWQCDGFQVERTPND